MRNLIRKGNFFKPFRNFNLGSLSKFTQKNYESSSKGQKQNFDFSMGFVILSSFFFAFDKTKCADKQQSYPSNQQPERSDIQFYQLNKNQLLQLLANFDEEGIIVVFSKYQRDQNEKQFSKSLENIFLKAKTLQIKRIYLVEKNDLRHLQIFEKWLRDQKTKNVSENDQPSSNQSKNQYYLLTPDFRNNLFKLQEEEIIQEVNQIRKFRIRVNPSGLKQQIFLPYEQIFNRTTVVKQCPEYVSSNQENPCIEEFRKNIAILIEQKMLKNKKDEFRFFGITANTKKDISPILNFQNALAQYQNEEKSCNQSQEVDLGNDKKMQNTYVLRNDLIGRQIQNMNNFRTAHYSMLKGLSSYDKFLLFIKPRIFIVSKANPSIDLYWYITCLHKNRHPSISINNTDSFNLGRKYQITNGREYPLNSELQFLRVLYINHPELNYVVINTQIASELIRHLPIKKRYTIFNLTSDLIYPKMFLPQYQNSLSPIDNYEKNFKSKIFKYTAHPALYDFIVLDQEKKINRNELQQMIKNGQSFILRICKLNCQTVIPPQKLKEAFIKLKNSVKSNTSEHQNKEIQKLKDGQVERKDWKNEVFKSTYWIDSHFNHVGLREGDYFFEKGTFSEL